MAPSQYSLNGFRPIRSACRAWWMVLAWFFVVAGRVWAAPQFTTSLDNPTIEVGDSTTLSLTFEDIKVGAPPQLPAMTNANVRYVGPESSYRFINGEASSSTSFRYVITPQGPGEVRVPALSINIDGRTYTSRPLVLRVVKPGGARGAAGGGASLDDFVSLKLMLPDREVFLGETFVAEVRLYTAVQVRELNPPVPKINLEGFVVGKNTPAQQTQTNINGRAYAVLSWRIAATAAKLGELTFGPAQAEAVVQLPGRTNRRRDPFGFGMLDEFFGNAELRRVELTSATNTLRVVPLPTQGKPADFSGAVGRFSLQVEASPTNVAVGEPITLRLRVSGEGNLDSFSAPQLADARGWKSYPPSTHVESTDPLGVSGTKTFELVVEPESPAIRAVPEIRMTFFDPTTRRYETLRHPSIPITIRPSSTTQAAPSRQAIAGEPVSPASTPGEEIQHIRQQPGRLSRTRGGNTDWLFGACIALLPVPLYALYRAWTERRDRLANDPVRQRRLQGQRALEAARASLREQARANDGAQFFGTLRTLLQERIGLTLDLPAAAITEDVLEDKLRPRGLSGAAYENLEHLFETLNQARYAPVSGVAALEELCERAESACSSLAALENPS